MPHDPARLRALSATPLGRIVGRAPIRYFRATMEGQAHLPTSGGALLVSNHALLGLDGFVLGPLVFLETGRLPRFLGERNLWRLPPLGRLLEQVGAIPGAPEPATELLRAGEIVIVYPGGIDDSFKTRDERYRLKWGTRAGFARIAMRAGVPIVPVAGFGIDEMYTVLGRERWLGRALMGSARYDLPIAFGAWGSPIPRRHPQRYRVLAPIATTGDPERPEDVERVRAAVHGALSAALADGATIHTMSSEVPTGAG